MRNNSQNTKTAFFLVFLMLATPMLSLETSLLSENNNSSKEFTSTKTVTTFSDCDLSNVTITEVYHYSSNEWIEIYNGGNQTCDLGEWVLGEQSASSS